MKLSLEDAKKIITEKKELEDDLDLSVSSSTELSSITDKEKPAG
jgi:chaperonin cofactor prefoldin